MKLRNKKTGEIVDAMFYAPMANYELILWKDKLDPSCHEVRLGNYKTLTELNEEWEDYTPKEPLIKDEKIRKAVRAWAEANGFERVYNQSSSYFVAKAQHIDFVRPPMIDVPSGNYTITELCGEEK